MIDDIDKGVVDRFLVSPAVRGSLIMGRLLQGTVVIVVQSLIIVGLALIVGAHFPNAWGVIVLIAIASLLGASFGALSNGLALLARREETVIAVMNFVLLPLTFLSTTFMQRNLIPKWMQRAADVNPVNWAVEAGRSAVLPGTDWGMVGTRVALLAGLFVVCVALSTRAFRAYQRSV